MSKTVGKSAQIDVQRRANYVRVVQSGCLDSLDAALEVQKLVESAAKGLERGLFDNRLTEAPAAAVAQAMWRWLQRRFHRAALILDAADARVNLRATSSHVKVRAFNDEDKALHWLTTSDSWPEAEVLVFEVAGKLHCIEASHIVEIIPCAALLRAPALPAGILGVMEHRKRVLSVMCADGERDSSNIPVGARVIVTETNKGSVGVLADKTIVLGQVAMEAAPRHGVALDSNLGVLTCLDPSRLADRSSR